MDRNKIFCKFVGAMERVIHFILVMLIASVPAWARQWRSQTIDSLMSQLDSVISNRPKYLEIKEARIADLKSGLAHAKDDDERFALLKKITDEYKPFNTDSAFVYIELSEKIAERTGNRDYIENVKLDRANNLCAIGMYVEALQLVAPISADNLPDYLKPYYYHTMRTLYGRLADYSAFEDDRRRYEKLTDMYRDTLMLVNQHGSLSNAISKADQLNARGKADEAIGVMRHFMSSNDLTEHERAICAWTLADSYAQAGDTAAQKEQLIISAIGDMKSAVREYISLRALALLLYQEGDLDRAYKFMNISMEDATSCNARHRILEINQTYPAINAIYVNKVRDQKRSLQWTVGLITVLMLFLVAVLMYLRKQMQRIAAARKTIEDANGQLQSLNQQLTDSNRDLQDANLAITENSRLKETYIGRYMDQCMEYIEKLDTYRKTIRKVAQSSKNDELKALVKSSADIDEELRSFYDNFDSTFLKLFPTFVEEFNQLLRPEEAILPKRPGSLNTELRIYALVRLGISDSDRIAKFLRYSLTTIYNYRTRTRNKAVGDRSQFDQKVLLIGIREQP